MIYTIGHSANYRKFYAEYDGLQKLGRLEPGQDDKYPEGYPGGYAFPTREDAQRRIDERYPTNGFEVFGLDAEWGVDTTPDPEGYWHNLIRDADIVLLDA